MSVENLEKPKPVDDYMSLTHISWDWGISNRILGKELKQAGYRWLSEPTKKALDEGLAIRRKGSGYQWSWERVGMFIQLCGCSDRDKPLVSRKESVAPVIIREPVQKNIFSSS